jgi:hypothetical protein
MTAPPTSSLQRAAAASVAADEAGDMDGVTVDHKRKAGDVLPEPKLTVQEKQMDISDYLDEDAKDAKDAKGAKGAKYDDASL